MNKSRHVTFRCTQEQYDELKASADKLGLTVSQFILRSLIFTSEAVKQNHSAFELLKDKS